jgi:hypothetical protein
MIDLDESCYIEKNADRDLSLGQKEEALLFCSFTFSLAVVVLLS